MLQSMKHKITLSRNKELLIIMKRENNLCYLEVRKEGIPVVNIQGLDYEAMNKLINVLKTSPFIFSPSNK